MGSDWSPDVYIKAYRYAATAHWNSEKKQLVPGTDLPYLMHFSMVAMEVIAMPPWEKNPVWTGTLLFPKRLGTIHRWTLMGFRAKD